MWWLNPWIKHFIRFHGEQYQYTSGKQDIGYSALAKETCQSKSEVFPVGDLIVRLIPSSAILLTSSWLCQSCGCVSHSLAQLGQKLHLIPRARSYNLALKAPLLYFTNYSGLIGQPMWNQYEGLVRGLKFCFQSTESGIKYVFHSFWW